MSLYGQYLEEREGKHTVESEHGFAVYKWVPEGCYIVDIFVAKDHRTQGLASQLADIVVDIARERGCTKLFGSIVPSAPGSTISMKVLLAYGFELYQASQDFIVMQKGI